MLRQHSEAFGAALRGAALLFVATILVVHVAGVGLDALAAVRFPFQLDYGEGIVWQQAVLIPGPRMYSVSPDLPFIVYHYPPLYYLIVRAMRLVQQDFLAAGRLVSCLATLLLAVSVSALVLIASRRPSRHLSVLEVASAIVAGMLVLCLHAVRTWGTFMRVDMLAIALSFAGLLLAAWADGRFWGILGALLLCVAAMFTKQTQFSAGIAVLLMALWRNPRRAWIAALIAGIAGLTALGIMEWITGFGFLRNIIGDNVNRLSLAQPAVVLWTERMSFAFAILMLVSFAAVLRMTLSAAVELRSAIPRLGLATCAVGRASAARVLVLLEFALATLTLPLMLKSGSSNNYLLEWLVTGCTLIGLLLADLAGKGGQHRRLMIWTATVLALVVAGLPVRQMPDSAAEPELALQAALVARIAAAPKPVASDNMTLLMRAGKPVIFEPAIVTELASLGRWDERRLINLIRAHGFAFMITADEVLGGTQRRTPAVAAAMRAYYPRVERVGPNLWLNLPPA